MGWQVPFYAIHSFPVLLALLEQGGCPCASVFLVAETKRASVFACCVKA